MLLAVMVLATAQARHEHRDNPNNVVTEQTTENTSEQEGAQQANENESNITDKVKLTDDGIVVKDDDGNIVKVKIDDLKRIINENLDDTVLSTTQDETIEINSENVNEMAKQGMDLAKDIAMGFFVAIVFIVFFSLLFYFLHRRRKYKTIDRAIQAGYPLPDEFFGKRSQHVPQQPSTVYVTQVTPPSPNPNAPQDAQTAPGMTPPNYGQSSNPLNNITDWTPFKKGIKITAWGLGLLFFFWILGAQPIAALMVIVVFIRLGKLFITYQEQQNLKNQWQYQQWTQQQQPQQAPNNMPPMPETPPEFDPNK